MMENKDNNSPNGWRLEAMAELMKNTGILSPSAASNTHGKRPKALQIDLSHSLEQELQDLCSLGEDKLFLGDGEQEDSFSTPESKSHAYTSSSWENLLWVGSQPTISPQVPTNLGRDHCKSACDPLQSSYGTYSEPEYCASPVGLPQTGQTMARRKLHKQRSWSIDVDHDELWERRKDFYAQRSSNCRLSRLCGEGKSLIRSVSDCGDTAWPQDYGCKSVSKSRSLTDEDLEELRGCLDLGFDFSNGGDPKLWDTLPALELCYAVSQQLKNEQSHSSPTSVLQNHALSSLDKTKCRIDTAAAESWVISSPGDHPQEVKNRLRNWAKAVALSVTHGF